MPSSVNNIAPITTITAFRTIVFITRYPTINQGSAPADELPVTAAILSCHNYYLPLACFILVF
jgi:hypothetical protein